jgi:hypothetical protein
MSFAAGQSLLGPGEEPPDNVLVGTVDDMEMAWHTFTLMQATAWRFLPFSGGLLDQPQLLMDNLFTLVAQFNEIKKDD